MASETRRNRPYAPRMSLEERREQLIDVAVGVVRSHGVHALNVDAVAKAAGVTRPVVYRVFEDANALFAAMLDREEERALAQLASVIPVPGTGDPIELAIEAVGGFLRAVLDEPERWSAILAPAEGVPEPMRERMERSRTAVRQQLMALVAWSTGALDGHNELDIELFARGLQALAEEGGRLVLADPESFPPERIVRFAEVVVPRYLSR